MLHYIFQPIAFQLFFLLLYDALLKKETFFNWNRAYLLITTMVSFVLPLIKIESLKEVFPQQFIIALPEVFLGQPKPVNLTPIAIEPSVVEQTQFLTWENLFYTGAVIAVIVFAFKLTRIFILIVKNPITKSGKLNLVHVHKSTSAFSFFNYIFLGESLNEDEKCTILKHEVVHANHRHSLDLILFEMLRILFWFNPLVYMFQNRMIALHEFIADAQAVKHQNKTVYYHNLLAQVFQTKNISFINPFYKQSLIKKRIVMLQKTKSKQIYLLKYALLLPLVTGMLIYTSCTAQNEVIEHGLDLNAYTYSVKPGETMSDEISIKQASFEAFLKTHPEYVSWAELDKTSTIATYSIHSVDEKAPDNFSEVTVNFDDGTNYKQYMQFDDGQTKEKHAQVLVKSKDRIIEVQTLPTKDYLKGFGLDVPFAVIDQVPVFPGCEGLTTQEEQRDCISKNIAEHVNRNFNIKLANELGLVGRQRINVIFKIDTIGNIVGVRSRAPHPGLEAEAIRVIKTLPRFEPGVNNGKKVNVPYSLPIIFEVAEIKKDN